MIKFVTDNCINTVTKVRKSYTKMGSSFTRKAYNWKKIYKCFLARLFWSEFHNCLPVVSSYKCCLQFVEVAVQSNQLGFLQFCKLIVEASCCNTGCLTPAVEK